MKRNKMKISMKMSTGFANCHHYEEIDVNSEWWESLTDEQKEIELFEMELNFISNHISVGTIISED